MTDLKRKIQDIVAANLGKEELFLVDIEISGSHTTQKITVLLDGDKGVSIEDCARISRKLGETIEEENLIENAYLLEISSPGIDEPLKLNRQYVKNIGRRVSVVLINEQVKVGKLEAVNDERIVIQEEIKDPSAGGKSKKIKVVPVEIQFNEIKKSNVLIAFNN
jgi:ribosome maturation factor RimP